MRAWYGETEAACENVGNERWMARARSVNNASISDSGAEKMSASLGSSASIFILRSIARLTKALGYDGFDVMMLSRLLIADSMVSVLESLDVCRIMSFCCVSSTDSCEEEIVG